MYRTLRHSTRLLAALGLLSTAVWADVANIGYVSWDVTFPGNSGSFDITNLTGPNALPPDFPVTTSVNLSSLNLHVLFSNGTSQNFGPSYFTLASDGLSFDGSPIAIGGTNPLPTQATLTGMFSPLTIALSGGGTEMINSSFTAIITPSSGLTLQDGDFALITATVSTGATPEPGTWLLLATGLGCLALFRRRDLRNKMKTITSAAGRALPGIAIVLLLVAAQIARADGASVTLSSATTPDTGTAGINDVSVTGSGFPSGTITPANIVVKFASTCGGPAVATTSALSVRTIVGSVKRVSFVIPGSLATGVYYVSISDSVSSDADFASSNCSKISVTHTNATLSACIPTSSLGVLVPTKPGTVTAYVPKGCWECGNTGIFVKNIEGAVGPGTSIITPEVTNSCSSNPATGETVCVSNNTNVYLIKGTSLNLTLNSGANTLASFSGGSCQNCGVAINALSNKAVIAGGFGGGASNQGVQILDLNTNVFSPPFPMQNRVSEDISIDPTRNLILTPGENSDYTILQIQSDGTTLKEFSGPFPGLTNDSAAEDCSTGIAMTPGEFSNSIYLEDLSQAVFSGASYTAPNSVFTLSTSYFFSAGLSGLTVAPGTAHLAVGTGEFGGNTFAALQLPAKGGSGTPTILDYAVAAIPDSATCAGTFNAGLDPHTVTAYTSPNDGKAYALFTGYASNFPICLARVDLAAVLAAPRGGPGLSANDVSAANFPASAVTFYSLP